MTIFSLKTPQSDITPIVPHIRVTAVLSPLQVYHALGLDRVSRYRLILEGDRWPKSAWSPRIGSDVRIGTTRRGDADNVSGARWQRRDLPRWRPAGRLSMVDVIKGAANHDDDQQHQQSRRTIGVTLISAHHGGATTGRPDSQSADTSEPAMFIDHDLIQRCVVIVR